MISVIYCDRDVFDTIAVSLFVVQGLNPKMKKRELHKILEVAVKVGGCRG